MDKEDRTKERKRKMKKVPVGARFSPPVQTGPGALCRQSVPGFFPGGNVAGAWR